MSAENLEKMKAAIKYCLRDGQSRLRLVNQGLRDSDMPALVCLLNENPTITGLDIGTYNIRDGIGMLAECKYLKKLGSEQNDLGNRGVIALANSNIQSLYLNGCYITDEAAEALRDRKCENSSVTLLCCAKVSPLIVEQIKQKNKENRERRAMSEPKKSVWERVIGFWCPKEVGKNADPSIRKSFEKK